MLLHIGQGQQGVIIVDAADESVLPPAREFVLVQTDLYPGKNGEISDYSQLQTADPEYVVFNGHANQYTGENALKIRKGERVRVFVQNAGPKGDFRCDPRMFDYGGSDHATTLASPMVALRPLVATTR